MRCTESLGIKSSTQQHCIKVHHMLLVLRCRWKLRHAKGWNTFRKTQKSQCLYSHSQIAYFYSVIITINTHLYLCMGQGVRTIVINQNTRADTYTQCLEVIYNCRYSHTLCFTQMHLRSDHRRDLLAALRCHIIWFTILGSIGTIQNISSSLSILFEHLDVKHIR